MRFIILFTTFLLSIGLAAQVHGQKIIEIEDDLPERIFSLKELEYFEDKSNALSFEVISSTEFSGNFNTNPAYNNKDYNQEATYWIRFSLYQPQESSLIWLLEFYDQTIDEIEAFIPTKAGSYQKLSLGDQEVFINREILHKNFEIIIDKSPAKIQTYYFKVNSTGFADIRIALRSVDRFIYYALSEYFLFGLFYGMILILSLYNLLMYFAIRKIKYLYYIFYLVSVGAYAMSIDGIGFQYLWPSHPEWNQIAHGIALYLVILWSLLFTQKFLNTKSISPVLHKIISAVVVIRSSIFIAALFQHNLFSLWYIEAIPLVLIFYTSIYIWTKGYKPARFFVMAYGILFLGFFIKILVNAGLIPFNILTHYSLHISFLIEMLFLSFALGDKVRILKNNRDRAQIRIIKQHELNVKLKNQVNQELQLNMELKEKVNRELEQKVKERTIELGKKNNLLEEYNKKLIQQAEKINHFNAMLDLDNWKLKNNVKENLENRFINKKLNIEEFKKIFPDKLACYRYLEKLKWENNFECKKCENNKYFNGQKKFSRRCTKCGYNESITAYTIFHGIKFPIEKAFYIAYLSMNGRKHLTLEEISQTLSLRVNTIWSFRNKIQEILKSNGYSKVSNAAWQNFLVDITPKKRASKIKAKV